MIDQKDLERKEAELEQLLAEKFGLKRGPLAQRLRKLGRRVPRFVTEAGQVLIEARGRRGHPKLDRMTDTVAVDRAYQTLRNHLRTVDVADRRKGALLSLLGSLAFNLLMVAGLLLIVLLWRGLL